VAAAQMPSVFLERTTAIWRSSHCIFKCSNFIKVTEQNLLLKVRKFYNMQKAIAVSP